MNEDETTHFITMEVCEYCQSEGWHVNAKGEKRCHGCGRLVIEDDDNE